MFGKICVCNNGKEKVLFEFHTNHLEKISEAPTMVESVEDEEYRDELSIVHI